MKPFRTRSVVLQVVVLTTAGVAAISAVDPSVQSAPQRAEFRQSIDLVRLSVTARDREQRLVTDLSVQEFEVAEDDLPQPIAHFVRDKAPISTAILVDRSSSMMEDDKIMHARDGVIAFLKEMKPDDEVALVAFGDSVEMLSGGFGISVQEAERAVRQIQPQGGTRLYDAVAEAARLIAAPERREKRAILILSDGEDTASHTTLEQAVAAVRAAGVPVYAIGIELNRARRTDPRWTRLNHTEPVQALARLAEDTGGWSYVIEAAKRCKEICIRVADELRNQYLLGYYPPEGTRDRRWREVTVRATRTGVTVATRSGYFYPASTLHSP